MLVCTLSCLGLATSLTGPSKLKLITRSFNLYALINVIFHLHQAIKTREIGYTLRRSPSPPFFFGDRFSLFLCVDIIQMASIHLAHTQRPGTTATMLGLKELSSTSKAVIAFVASCVGVAVLTSEYSELFTSSLSIVLTFGSLYLCRRRRKYNTKTLALYSKMTLLMQIILHRLLNWISWQTLRS